MAVRWGDAVLWWVDDRVQFKLNAFKLSSLFYGSAAMLWHIADFSEVVSIG